MEYGCYYNSKVHIAGKKGPLSGLVFSAKDCFDVKGYVTSFGNPGWAESHKVAHHTSDLITQLVESGASLQGKTHLNELTFGLDGQNIHFGMPVNPLGVDRIPGGSSSGSAVSVAAGLADFSLGTDTAGSIRIPASYCGVFGIRPTHSLLSTQGIIPLSQSFDVPGCFARSPEIFTEVLNTLIPKQKEVQFTKAIVPDDVMGVIDPEIRSIFKTVQAKAASIFANINFVTLTPDNLHTLSNLFRTIQGYEVWNNHGKWFKSYKPKVANDVAKRINWASTVTKSSYDSGKKEQELFTKMLVELLGDDSVILMPTAPCHPPLINSSTKEFESHRVKIIKLTSIAGLGGVPEISIPVNCKQGSIGISIIGPKNSERSLVALAVSLQKIFNSV
ncbi:MAG: amidase [Magnetococcales bacterium]|nr:amidase [Magnetococcales bacterium]